MKLRHWLQNELRVALRAWSLRVAVAAWIADAAQRGVPCFANFSKHGLTFPDVLVGSLYLEFFNGMMRGMFRGNHRETAIVDVLSWITCQPARERAYSTAARSLQGTHSGYDPPFR